MNHHCTENSTPASQRPVSHNYVIRWSKIRKATNGHVPGPPVTYLKPVVSIQKMERGGEEFDGRMLHRSFVSGSFKNIFD
jgi:hypothetical protein